ncbi:Prolyl aminopeptidase [Lentibacillus sp. JNUCC-1]|uniref:alpha/beta fold hydrolase n=1 Tax=Lentibacillus sp. JNUCC-1 TaxID=2654513 RepID=UPI0012E93B38|nr:alpha/beta fold hydrolase [Lentibacillus sp. JNUCC-1]MUV37294.1 Prolyl aminopeptidase [Lentibacillus sp. JNUCC-1]
MFAEVNGTRLFFDVEGAGVTVEGGALVKKDVCFVLHGGPGGTHLGFKPYLSPLAEDLQLVYIDNRGSGFSATGPVETYTLDQNIEDIEALRQHLGLEQIVLFGHSYGGMTAMAYAARYPKNVKALLLSATSPSYRFLDKAKQYVERHGTAEQKEMAQLLWDGAFSSDAEVAHYYEVMAPLYSRKTADGKAEPRPEMNRSYEALNQGFGGFLRNYDLTEDLKTLQCPALVSAGRHDWITPVEENELIAELLPNSEFVVFEDSSHGILKDQHEDFINTVREFIRNSV